MKINWLKNSIFLILNIFLLLGTVGATKIVEFNFNNATKTGTINNNTTFINSPYTADNGIVGNINASIISLVGGSLFTSWVQGADGLLASSPSTNTWINGSGAKYWMINFSNLGYGNLKVFSKQQSSSTGPRDFKVQYSTGGAIWTDIPGSTITVASNFTSGVLSGINLPSELNNQSNVYLRWIMTSNTSVGSGVTATGGTQRIDDIVVLGTELYTVTYTGGTNGIVSGNLSQTVLSGNNASTVAAIASTGYYFVNRSDGSTANPRTDANITGNISVTANFAINQYLVTFQDYNSTILSTGLVNHGSSATPPSNPTRTGYTFSGWNPSNFSNITGATTITAQYSINQYLVTFQDYNSTILSTGLVNHGSSATPPANPTRTGYTFSGWNPSTFSNITGATTITAQYSINQYTIIFFSNGGTNVSTITGNYNTAVIIPSNPMRTGYTFNGWSPILPTNIPAQNIIVTAQWIENNLPTINTGTSSGGGGGSISKDNCPNGDYTSSYYDRSCGIKPSLEAGNIIDSNQSIKYSSIEIFNNSIPNGYCYNRKDNINIVNSLDILTSTEFKKAMTFLYSYDMTIFNKVDDFSPYRTLTREEAAKLFSNFAMNVLCRKPDTSIISKYDDMNSVNDNLKPYIIKAYQLGLMKGGENNIFRPKDIITKAEVNAVLIRMLLKRYLPENTNTIWYNEYNKVSTELGIIKYGAGIEAVSRNDVSLMLFRAYKDQFFSLQNIEYESFVLQNRDQFML